MTAGGASCATTHRPDSTPRQDKAMPEVLPQRATASLSSARPGARSRSAPSKLERKLVNGAAHAVGRADEARGRQRQRRAGICFHNRGGDERGAQAGGQRHHVACSRPQAARAATRSASQHARYRTRAADTGAGRVRDVADVTWLVAQAGPTQKLRASAAHLHNVAWMMPC